MGGIEPRTFQHQNRLDYPLSLQDRFQRTECSLNKDNNNNHNNSNTHHSLIHTSKTIRSHDPERGEASMARPPGPSEAIYRKPLPQNRNPFCCFEVWVSGSAHHTRGVKAPQGLPSLSGSTTVARGWRSDTLPDPPEIRRLHQNLSREG